MYHGQDVLLENSWTILYFFKDEVNARKLWGTIQSLTEYILGNELF